MENDNILDLNDFEMNSKIGKGGFAIVYKVTKKETKEIFAAKMLRNDIDSISRDEMLSILHEVNIMSKLNHPSILRFYGYSPINFKDQNKPIILTEFASNGDLKQLIQLERQSMAISGWDDTKKLIIIYGIASGMSYLHKNNIIHRDLKPENILMDDILFPKISDFGLSKTSSSKGNTATQSNANVKGTPKYIAPEIWETQKYGKEGDVYSFALILYELVTNEVPFKDIFSITQVFINVVVQGRRPEFTFPIPNSYRELIEKCWSYDPCDRPTFDQILSQLKNDESFITDSVDRDDYWSYIDYVEQYQSSFDQGKTILKLKDVFNSESKTFQLVTIDQSLLKKQKIREEEELVNSNDNYNDNESMNPNSNKDSNIELCNKDKNLDSNDGLKNKNSESNKELGNKSFDLNDGLKNKDSESNNELNNKNFDSNDGLKNKDSESNKELNNKNKNSDLNDGLKNKDSCLNDFEIDRIVKDADGNANKEFIVGRNYFEGINGFSHDSVLGIKYLKKACKGGSIESTSYYCRLLIEGKLIPRNIQKAKKYLTKCINSKDPSILTLYGKVQKEEGKLEEAEALFKKAAEAGSTESMFEYGKMHYYESIKYLMMAQNNGCKESREFLNTHFKEPIEEAPKQVKLTENIKNDDNEVKKKEEKKFFKFFSNLKDRMLFHSNKKDSACNEIKLIESDQKESNDNDNDDDEFSYLKELENRLKMNPSVPGRKRAILLCTGSFCPIHKGHFHLLNTASKFLREEHNIDSLFGILSPSSDKYVKSRLGDEIAISFHHRYETLKLACSENNSNDENLFIIPNSWEGKQERFIDFPQVRRHFEEEVSHKFPKENITVLYVCGGDLFMKALCYLKEGYVGIARPGFKINIPGRIREDVYACNDKKYTGFYSDATMAIKMAKEKGESIKGLTYDSVADYLHNVVHWI